MADLKLSSSDPTTINADALVLGVTDVDATGDLADALRSADLGAKTGSTVTLHAPTGYAARKVVAVRLPQENDVAAVRRAVAHGVRAAGAVDSVAVSVPLDDTEQVETAGTAGLLAGYAFSRFKSEPKKSPQTVTLLTPDARKTAYRSARDRAQIVAEAVAAARDWVNCPPGDLPPATFASEAADLAKKHGVSATVWTESKLAREKCGGILGVGRGSENPPRLVRLRYKPSEPVAHLALVGKGITFDSGGLSLKPGASMMTMKCDMAGAAAILAATTAIAALELPIQVTAFAAMAENMPSGTATRPGDVLTLRDGQTVEILNTDAEGRLVLADGLALATETDADQIVDVATLTGAAMVALGSRTSGVFSTDDALRDALHAAGDRAGERMWPMPLTEELVARTSESAVADLRQHNPKPHGGAIYAAAFLSRFVEDRTWAHLDIAGPSFNEDGPYDDVPLGGTGVAVRTLIEHARSLAQT